MKGHEFYKIVNIYKDVEKEDEEGNKYTEEILYKKNIKLKWYCANLEDITDYEEVVDFETGKKERGLTLVNHKSKGSVIIKMSYEEFNKLFNKEKNVKVNGFNKN